MISAAAAILQDSTTPHVFLGGEQHLLDWPQLDGKVGTILTLLNDEEEAARLIARWRSRMRASCWARILSRRSPACASSATATWSAAGCGARSR